MAIRKKGCTLPIKSLKLLFVVSQICFLPVLGETIQKLLTVSKYPQGLKFSANRNI